jgi:hypothetical protein
LSVPMRRLSPPARIMPVMVKITVFTMRCQQGSARWSMRSLLIT